MNADGPASAAAPRSYLTRPEGRIGYDIAGQGPLVLLVPGVGDLRAAYRFLAPALRESGYPQSQRPGITTGAIQRFLESVPAIPSGGLTKTQAASLNRHPGQPKGYSYE